MLASAAAAAAQTHTTIRHHTVAESTAAPVKPEVTQAEAALDRKDYAAAEPLLKKAVSDDARDYRAWFDLGLLYKATNRRADAIDAYRNSVAADSSFFESNFNLGVTLAAA
ncbi:MAG TPA: tetratricopeptide repeat protein, partial [Terriglobales bacterium]|nr:tetratricopeptide repeat protein [Terriglobales bacterium]